MLQLLFPITRGTYAQRVCRRTRLLRVIVMALAPLVGCTAKAPRANPPQAKLPTLPDPPPRPTSTGGPPLGTVPESPAEQPTLEKFICGIQRHYEAASTFRATFFIRTNSKTLSVVRSGEIAFEPPNKARWDFTIPNGDIVVVNGSTTWVYSASKKVAYTTDLWSEPWLHALTFVRTHNLFDVMSNMKVVRISDMSDTSDLNPEVTHALTGVVRTEMLATKVVLLFDEFDSEVHFVRVQEVSSPEFNKFHFKYAEFGRPLNSSLFKFVLPPGAKMIPEPKH